MLRDGSTIVSRSRIGGCGQDATRVCSLLLHERRCISRSLGKPKVTVTGAALRGAFVQAFPTFLAEQLALAIDGEQDRPPQVG